jgi:hypothetical protein
MAGEASHFHVIAENQDGELICSDGFTWPHAHGFAADLISPPGGVPVYEPVRTVWITECAPVGCPLAHGDNVPADEGAVPGFLELVVQQEPYWSA